MTIKCFPLHLTLIPAITLIAGCLTYQRAAHDTLNNHLDQIPKIKVRGVIGGRVLLPCDIAPPTPTDSPILVRFYVDNRKTPIYSLDSRRSSLYAAQHWSDPEMEGRLSLQVDVDHNGLVLQKVRAEDEGAYLCRVDFKASPTRNSKIILDVIEPPRHLLVTSKWKDERVVSKVAGPFPESAEILLSCQVIGGDPPPKVTWWHEGALLDDFIETRTNQMSRNTLRLPPLTRSDLMKKLTCQAINSNLTTPLSATVEIDLAFPPTSVRILTPNSSEEKKPSSVGRAQVLVVSEGDKNPIRCEVEGSRPQAEVSWNMDGNPINTKYKVITNPSVPPSAFTDFPKLLSTLLFIPDAKDNGSLITCKALNPQLPDETLYATAQLNVLYKPRVVLTEGKKIELADVREGTDIYFECQTDANPPTNKIIWAQDGVTLKHNPIDGVLLSSTGTSLILQDVKRTFTGTYTCTAVNAIGSTVSNDLRMNVKFVPACASVNDTTIGGGLKESVKARCDVSSHPPATKFRWAFNSSRGLHDISDYPHQMVNDSSSVLEYKIGTTDDFGAFLCWASNPMGTMKNPCVINVIPAAKPESVSGCEIFHNGSFPGGRVLIQCIPGWDGGLPQSFTLEVRKAAHYKTKVLSALQRSPEPIFNVRDLPTGEKYLFTVIASNSRGASVPVTLFYTIPGEIIAGLTHAHTDPPKSLHKYMPMIAIGLGVVVTLSVMVGAAVCACKIRYQKRNPLQLKKVEESITGSGGDSSVQSIVEQSSKEDENSKSVTPISCYDDCSTYGAVRKSHDCIHYPADLRTHTLNHIYQREKQGLLTPLRDEGDGSEELRFLECHRFLLQQHNYGNLSNSLGRSSTISSGSSVPSTLRSSYSTVVLNPKFNLERNEEIRNQTEIKGNDITL